MRILRRYTVRFRGGKTRFVGRVLALHGSFHAAQAGFQCADAVAEHIGQRLLVQVVRRAGLAAAHADHFGRNTDRGGIGRQIFEHHTARADTDIIPDIHRAKHLGTGTDQHVIAQCGVALAGILASAAQGNAVVDGAVITDFCRFAEHDAHTVVNEQPVADLGTGVDLDAGQVAGQLADEARQEETLVTLLVLKLMSFYNGAVLAAITTSLPETIGEVRNWDYRFCWLRDASMSIETLFQIGHVEAARRFMRFVQSTFVSQHDTYQIMYGIRGERKLTEVILGHLSGYKNSRPVRIGNDAYHQLQNDSFGYLMDLIYQYYRLMPGTLDEVEDMWEMVKSILTNVMIDWKKPDKGIWEIRGEGQHFVSSKVMCWVALDRGARIADLLNKPTYRRRWSEEATVIKENVMKNGWKEEMQSFSQTYGNSDLDASLLLMEPYGFIDPRDIRYHKTVQAIKNALLYKGLMYRYKSHDDFGLPSSAFTICTFWLIRALYVIGEKEEARSLFEEMLHNSNHLGLFSEDIDFETKEQLGNFPQAYSHLALVNTAILFSEEDIRLFFK